VAIGTARRYLTLRLFAVGLLALHLGVRLIFRSPTIFSDLILFNVVAFAAALSAYFAPLFNDHFATASLGTALGLWASGSLISSWNTFMSFHIWTRTTDIAYALFYPFLLFGMVRALSARKKVKALELLDVIIIGLGISSLLASLLLAPAMLHINGSAFSVFLSILYPIGDCILLAIALLAVILQIRSARSIIMFLGVAIFAATDLYFLWKSATTGYPFASLIDDGWVLALLIIAESLWHQGGEGELSERVTSISATVALIASATILGIAAVRPHYFPTFALVPALITIMLAFLRMSVALREARSADHDRELARTDELTGLANRRRFLAEIEILGRRDGTLLLLDLDGFKAVNDTLGHDVGDQLLKQISIRFARAIPHGVLLARLGGDEFGVIIYGSEVAGLEVAQALRASLSYPFTLAGQSVNVGVSIGRVLSDGKGELLKRADSAMYEAKRTGDGIARAEN
jgi:diguanylate cyclase